jgi:hypothetical protein
MPGIYSQAPPDLTPRHQTLSEASVAHDDLQRHLIAAQDGEIPPESFIEVPMGSEVFMRIGGLQTQ